MWSAWLIQYFSCSHFLLVCSGKAFNSGRYVSFVPCTSASRWGDVSSVIHSNKETVFTVLFLSEWFLNISSSFFPRAANLYVSMNEGLSFISSSVTITTVSCVSIVRRYNVRLSCFSSFIYLLNAALFMPCTFWSPFARKAFILKK